LTSLTTISHIEILNGTGLYIASLINRYLVDLKSIAKKAAGHMDETPTYQSIAAFEDLSARIH